MPRSGSVRTARHPSQTTALRGEHCLVQEVDDRQLVHCGSGHPRSDRANGKSKL